MQVKSKVELVGFVVAPWKRHHRTRALAIHSLLPIHDQQGDGAKGVLKLTSKYMGLGHPPE